MKMPFCMARKSTRSVFAAESGVGRVGADAPDVAGCTMMASPLAPGSVEPARAMASDKVHVARQRVCTGRSHLADDENLLTLVRLDGDGNLRVLEVTLVLQAFLERVFQRAQGEGRRPSRVQSTDT